MKDWIVFPTLNGSLAISTSSIGCLNSMLTDEQKKAGWKCEVVLRERFADTMEAFLTTAEVDDIVKNIGSSIVWVGLNK